MFLWPKNVYGWFVYLILEYLCRTLILLISFFSISVIEWGSFLLQYGFLITEICYLGRWNFLSLPKWDNTKKKVTIVSLTTNNLSKTFCFIYHHGIIKFLIKISVEPSIFSYYIFDPSLVDKKYKQKHLSNHQIKSK